MSNSEPEILSRRRPRKHPTESQRVVTTIRQPDQALVYQIARELRLSEDRTHNLGVVLQQVYDDLAWHRARTKTPRAELVRRFRLIERRLNALKNECERHKKFLAQILPADTRAQLGAALTLLAMKDLANIEIREKNHIHTLVANRLGEKPPPTVYDIDKLSLAGRESLGIAHAGDILPSLLNRLHAPMERWIAIERQKRGGRPVDFARAHLLRELARNAPDLIGRKATTSSTGPFMELCNAVFQALGLSADGLDKSVQRAVSAIRGKRAGSQKAGA